MTAEIQRQTNGQAPQMERLEERASRHMTGSTAAGPQNRRGVVVRTKAPYGVIQCEDGTQFFITAQSKPVPTVYVGTEVDFIADAPDHPEHRPTAHDIRPTGFCWWVHTRTANRHYVTQDRRRVTNASRPRGGAYGKTPHGPNGGTGLTPRRTERITQGDVSRAYESNAQPGNSEQTGESTCAI